jgi:hypothetical protein
MKPERLAEIRSVLKCDALHLELLEAIDRLEAALEASREREAKLCEGLTKGADFIEQHAAEVARLTVERDRWADRQAKAQLEVLRLTGALESIAAKDWPNGWASHDARQALARVPPGEPPR